MKLNKREVKLLEEMAGAYNQHAARALRVASCVGKKQHSLDMERVALLEKILLECEETE